ncbi:DUF4350 domain-containing protein [uncultured Streptomyces sp.]|uniref:DUF4350 domain-containing protein n=1 Tax=uncultured Streptomyces sp. TaxID=174707 RepID=UPI00263212DE|nr:DUF4350 domain-containing protein [uncultured Streptomyces sp.]
MSAPTGSRPATSAPSAPSTSLSAPPGAFWKRARRPLLALLVLTVGAVALATARSGEHHGRLDPRSAAPEGSRAVAELLKDRGVGVTVVTALDAAVAGAGPTTTLLVTAPDLLTASQRDRLRNSVADSAGRTVLIAPGTPALRALAPGARVSSTPAEVTPRDPGCDLPAARAAGSALSGGVRYDAPAGSRSPGTAACYPADGLPTLLVLPSPEGRGDTVLAGSPDFLHNRRLADEGNASLALQLLGSRPHLVWYLPSFSDPTATDGGADGGDAAAADGESFVGLLPSGWLWAAFQLAVAALLAALWRGRRLGPLVVEDLPVVIRASEATEGLARLYRRGDARARAAVSLRTAARRRIAPLVGVSPRDAHSPDVLLPALSARLAGSVRPSVPADPLPGLLFGPPPPDDDALVRLADQLDALEREVRTS